MENLEHHIENEKRKAHQDAHKDEGNKNESEQNKRAEFFLYSLLGLSLMLSLIPSIMAATGSAFAFLLALIASYAVRGYKSNSSFTKDHAQFVITTIWIGSTLAVLTLIVGSVYLFFTIDNAPLMPCLNSLADPSLLTEMTNHGDIQRLLNPCFKSYFAANKMPLIIGGAITLGPVIIYFIVRYIKGLRRLVRGESFENAKAWL